MTMRLYAATTNPGKLRDFAYAAEGFLLNGERIQIEPLPDLKEIAAPAEDGATFEANARVKAIYYAERAPGALVLADDSGLEVTCLENAPGVRSARYAEDQGFPAAPASTLDERNNAALLRALDGVPEACRQARYRCVLALARCMGGRAEVVATAEGALEGVVLNAPRGGLGFGYDPLFLIPELGLTMAEVDPVTRLGHSHRGRALRRLVGELANQQTGEPAVSE
jgi:XTP/dITP diphosphohydrolase